MSNNIITLEEAKAMITDHSTAHLKSLVEPKPNINMDGKVNNDILMGALCLAVSTNVIHTNAIDDKLLKLLNSSTNTLSAMKLGPILNNIRNVQPNMCCVIQIKKPALNTVVQEWVFTGPKAYFNGIFEYVIDEFKITPYQVRTELSKVLKTTIVNNVAQLIAKYRSLETDDEKRNIPISIITINRLVNMVGYTLTAEFKEIK